MFTAGDHVPLIPLLDVVGNGFKEFPAQIGATDVNTGTTGWLTEIVILAVIAHCPADGVNVYVVVAVLFRAGDHEPEMPLLDVVGKGFMVSPAHIAFTGLKMGVVPGGDTVTVTVAWYRQVVVSRNAISSNAKSFPPPAKFRL